MANKGLKLKCVQLKGELNDWGKHVYFPDMGVTLCGCFTNDYNKEQFKKMPEGVTSEYEVVEWDIACEKCLDLTDMFSEINSTKKHNKIKPHDTTKEI